MSLLPPVPENLENIVVVREFLAKIREVIETGLESDPIFLSQKGQPNGVPVLDGSGLIPTNELGTGVADGTKVLKGDRTWGTAGGGGGGDIKSDGSVPFAANESMGGNKLTNVGTPTVGTDATNKTYVDTQEALDLRLDGTRPMTGALNMNTHLINNVVDPVSAQDAATKNYVDTHDKYAAVRIVGSGVGVTDATIAAAVAALPAAGGDIYVKPGTYAIASSIDFTTKVVRIHGAGTSVNFTTGPVTLVPGANVSVFKNGEQGCSIEDITIEGDNTTSQVLYEGSAEIRFARINCHDVAGIIKFASSQPEVTIRDSYINVPSGVSIPVLNRFLWKGGAANGKLIFDNVELFITGDSATIMSGITAGANGPEFRVTNSYVGGGGGGSAPNLWFAQVLDWNQFDIDNAQFEVSGARNNIVNSNFLDFQIKFKALWNFLSNCNFSQGGTGGSFFDAQLTFVTASQCIVSGCNFYGNSASVNGIRITGIPDVSINGCIFTNHTSQAIIATGTSTLSVSGCRFTETVPMNETASTITGRYTGNTGFTSSVIAGPDSVVEGVRRKDVVGGTTTDPFVTQFTHVNAKGLTGGGSIKNTGGSNTMTVRITAIDVYGTTDTALFDVLPGASATWSMADAVGTSLPPFVSYAVAVQSTSAGNSTTFTLHHATAGAY